MLKRRVRVRLSPLFSSVRYTLFFLAYILSSPSKAVEIKVNQGKYQAYYHINFLLNAGQYSINHDYGFNAGGQFEVLVPKEYFPIAAPNCNANIIIRMPWSENEAKKRALYDRLLNQTSINVVLELNPYIKQIALDPLQLELTYCNVFFRHKAGDYFDRL